MKNSAKTLHIESRSWTQRRKLQQSLQDESEELPIGRSTQTPQQILMELVCSTASSKSAKLLKQFCQVDRNTQLQHIRKQLNNQQIINLYFRVESIQRQDKNQQNIIFMGNLLESLSDHHDYPIFKLVLLYHHENFAGHEANIEQLLQILVEVNNLKSSQNLEDLIKNFENQQSVELFWLSQYSRIHPLKISFLTTQFSMYIYENSQQHFLMSLRQTISTLQTLEGVVFTYIRQQEQFDSSSLKNLVTAYLLVSYQLTISHTLNLTQQAIELLGKQDVTHYELIRGFLRNASKLASKYLQQGEDAATVELIQSIYKKSLQQVFHLDTLLESILLEYLEILYISTTAFKEKLAYYAFHLQTCSNPEYNLLGKLFPQKLTDHMRSNSRKILISKVGAEEQQRNNSAVRQSIFMPTKTKTSAFFIKKERQPESIDTFDSISRRGNEEYEQLAKEMKLQKQELESLKVKQNSTTNKSQEIDKFKSQIDNLESTIQQLKVEGLKSTKEKESKEKEVNDLKQLINELQEKQKKLEKLVQVVPMRPPSPDLPNVPKYQSDKWSKNLQNSLQIQGNHRTTSKGARSSMSQLDEQYMDEGVLAPVNQQAISFFENGQLETGVCFSKIFVIAAPNSTVSTTDSQIWETDYTEMSRFRVDAQFTDSIDGKSILLRAFVIGGTEPIATETITFDLVKNLISLLEIGDVLPTNFPANSIQTTHQFFKHIILPFVVVTVTDDARYKIQIWPKAPGLMSGLSPKIEFLNYQCLVFFHHIEADQFRVVVCDQDQLEIRIDVEMDYSSMDFLFENAKAIRDEYIFQVNSAMFKLTEKIEDENMVKRKFIQSKKINFDPLGQVFPLEQFNITKKRDILNLVRTTIQSVESYLSQGSVSSALSSKRYFKLKTWNNITKSQLQIVTDQPNHTLLQIELKNTHSTFGPNKTNLKATGKTNYPYTEIQKEFGVNFNTLPQDEKTVLMQQVLCLFGLQTFEKATDITEQQFDKNPIIQYPLEYGQYNRFAVQDGQGVSAVTISIVGCQRRMLGFKLSLYDPDDASEYGVFFTATQSDWDLRSLEKQKGVKTSIDSIPYSEYFLMQIFSDSKVQNLLFNRVFNQNLSSGVRIKQSDIKKRRNQIEKIDGLLNLEFIS